jgi:hypothetical protein
MTDKDKFVKQLLKKFKNKEKFYHNIHKGKDFQSYTPFELFLLDELYLKHLISDQNSREILDGLNKLSKLVGNCYSDISDVVKYVSSLRRDEE